MKKRGRRGIFENRDVRQVHSTRRVQLNCQNRDLLKQDVCSCLACPKTFPRSSTGQKETRRCHSCFIRMISRTCSGNDTSCNRVSNAAGPVNGLTLSESSLLNKGPPLAFRRLPESKVGSKVHSNRFLTRNDSTTARAVYPGWSDCLPTWSKC